jgi:DNA-directed RNA polymerase specialized sigma24 family protein
VLKSRQTAAEVKESVSDLLCEQYLPRVFRYVSYWVDNRQSAEDLTLNSLKQALARYGSCCKNESIFSIGVFAVARKEIQDYLRISSIKPIRPNLSPQEQEVISLKLGAMLDNRRISKITGFSESSVSTLICQSLCKLAENRQVLR